jgi:hypothetical protein
MSEVEIKLNEKTETLRCSLGAAKKVNSAGSFGDVLVALSKFDMSAYILVVSAGLGKKPAEVENDVYLTGMPNLTELLARYVELLANGGRPLSQSVGVDAAGEG